MGPKGEPDTKTNWSTDRKIKSPQLNVAIAADDHLCGTRHYEYSCQLGCYEACQNLRQVSDLCRSNLESSGWVLPETGNGVGSVAVSSDTPGKKSARQS
jgi:hypothetical protein